MRSVVFTGPLLLALELATFPVTSARAAGPTLLPAFGCTGFVFANGPSTPSNCQLSQSSYLVFNNASFPGADPTGATNSSTAFNNLFAAMCANKQSAIIPSGTYTLTAGMVWNFSTCPFGFKLLGDSHGQTILNFKGSATVGWQWIVSGGTGPSNVIPHVYDELGNMTVSCNSSTICWELGQPNAADVFESSQFHDLYVSNTYAAAGSIAARVNGANSNTWTNDQAGVTPSTNSSAGYGIAFQFTMSSFNTFINPSFGNSNVGVQFTDLGNSAIGFNYADSFIDMDMENVCFGVVLANSANSATTKINFIGSGQMYTIGPSAGACPMYSNQMSSPLLPDGNVIFDNVNLGSNLPYGGTTQPFFDSAGTHWQGVRIVGAYGSPVTSLTPSGSASGCNTNLFTNKTGQTLRETITGTYTAYCLNGQTIAYASGGSTTIQFQVDPGETFGVQYSSTAPSIIQQPLTH